MNEVIDKLDALVQSGGADFVLAEQLAAGLGIQLESLPTVKKYTPVIEFFNLFIEGYDNLDDGIQNLIPLKKIKLDTFGLLNLPSWIFDLTDLEELGLYSNFLRTLPIQLCNLTALKYLWLRHNKITELPNWIDQLKSLELLDLSANELRTLPIELCNLPALRGLNLTDNKITELPSCISNLRALEELRLQGNNLTELPIELAHLKSLEYVEILGNPIDKSDPTTARVIAQLKVNGTELDIC